MTREEFKNLTEEGIIYLDGATGSNLQKRGMPSGVCPDLWMSENPEVLIGLQMEYLRAGTRILYSPTFTANRIKLAEFGLEDRLEELNGILVGESKEAIRRFKEERKDAPECFVAGDITMTGRTLKPMGDLDFEELIDIYKEQIKALEKAGADLIVVETMMSLQETRAAVIACREVSSLPIIATLSFEKDGRTLYGTDPVTALITLQSLGVSAFGANCSTGPSHMRDLVSGLKKYSEIPVICKPNAGLPALNENGDTVYEMSPEEFGAEMELIRDSGAGIMGGCCGTTPEHIRELKTHTFNRESKRNGPEFTGYALTSERNTLTFTLDERFFIIGERINPTGKKALQAELRESRFDMVTEFALSQEEKGARVLDINVGMSGVDEKALMLKAVETVTEATGLPLSIDTSHVDIMEAALRRYPGRALINSVSLEEKKCEPMLTLASKYGAMCILLPLSDRGIPETLEEKKSIIRELVKRAEKHGLRKRDLIVDGLVGTVGANPSAALDTLETIRFCREELGLGTVCGLSNISFGLPERIFVNSAFLTMAINAGLTMAIANPEQERLVISALTADLLMGKKDADTAYIEYMDLYRERHENEMIVKKDGAASGAKQNGGGEKSGTDTVFEAVLKGKRETIAETVEKALRDGRQASDILNNSLLPAINRVGVLFDNKKYFLPQLIASGEAMKNGIEVIEPLLQEDGDADRARPVIVIGTVAGDIHDIGKNLVILMLKNYGFEVVDLGKDVSKEEFYETAVSRNARIIAMSALMTTTMREMKNVIDYCREKGYSGDFMIGGAVITEDYAHEIGAIYSGDAADAVRVANRICGE